MSYKDILIAAFCCVSYSSVAQKVAQKTTIQPIKDSIILTTKEKHAALLDAYINYNKGRGNYRIQIISGSLAAVNATLENLDSSFITWPKRVDFESPSFRLRIGDFRTRLEAERMLIRVRKKYPAAVLLKPQLIKKQES